MERLLWIILACGIGAVANWYYPQKYQPQIDALQAAASRIGQDRDAVLARYQSLQTEFTRATAALTEAAQRIGQEKDALDAEMAKEAAQKEDYEARLAKLESSSPPVGVPSATPPASAGPSPAQLKAATDAKAAAEARAKQKTADQTRLAQIAGEIAALQNKETGLKDRLDVWLRQSHHSHTSDLPAQITDCDNQIDVLAQEQATLSEDLEKP